MIELQYLAKSVCEPRCGDALGQRGVKVLMCLHPPVVWVYFP